MQSDAYPAKEKEGGGRGRLRRRRQTQGDRLFFFFPFVAGTTVSFFSFLPFVRFVFLSCRVVAASSRRDGSLPLPPAIAPLLTHLAQRLFRNLLSTCRPTFRTRIVLLSLFVFLSLSLLPSLFLFPSSSRFILPRIVLSHVSYIRSPYNSK